MTEIKNCPSCGGTLDDTGRCLYCKSKVYDLTDINIDLNSRDVIKLKMKHGKNTIIMNCYPASVSMEQSYFPCTAVRDDGSVFLKGQTETTIKLELVSY